MNSGLITIPPLKLNPFNSGYSNEIGKPSAARVTVKVPMIKAIEVKNAGNVLPVLFCLFLAQTNIPIEIIIESQNKLNKIEDPDNEEFLNIILRETDRITKIIDQISKKNFQLNQKLLNIHSVLEKIPAFVNSLDLKTISVERDYDPSIPLINVDDNLLTQVFYNLARNSIEAIESAKKGTKLIIRTRIIYETFINKTFHKSACLIEISDNGPGIPEDLIDSIFFPLVSTKEITSGLGLAISRGIITQHNGEIDCVSDKKGTTFSIILPIEERSDLLKEEINA